MTEQDLPDGKTVKWTYDNGGRPTQVVDWNGTYLTTYDAINRKTQETLPTGQTIKHTYDPMGNETGRVDYLGNKYSYTYDALNRPVQVTDSLNGLTGMVYDRMQHVLQIHYPNKTSVNTVYDATYDVLSVINKKDTGEIFSKFVYTYDAVGNKLTVTDNIGKTTYGYDAIYELTSAAYPDRPTVSYAYDPAGNRSSMTVGSVNTTYSYDTANKLMTAGTVSYTYDGNGNPVSKTDSSNSQTTTYTYDTENRMIGATLSTGSQFVFGYDYTGMKVSDTQKGAAGVLNTQQYLWSDGSVVNEEGTDGQIAHNVVGTVNLSQIYTPKTTKNNMVSYYLFDGLGSVADVTDATGNIQDSYRYDAYGATLSGGKNKDNWYQFVGKMGVENQPYIGLTYMRNRWYDPVVGRFMTQDPSGISGGLNLYSYTLNNPINGIDFMGLCSKQSEEDENTEIGKTVLDAPLLKNDLISQAVSQTDLDTTLDTMTGFDKYNLLLQGGMTAVKLGIDYAQNGNSATTYTNMASDVASTSGGAAVFLSTTNLLSTAALASNPEGEVTLAAKLGIGAVGAVADYYGSKAISGIIKDVNQISLSELAKQ